MATGTLQWRLTADLAENRLQRRIWKFLLHRKKSENKQVFSGEMMDEYCVVSTGARVTTESSIRLITKYCQNLPGDKYFIPQPTFKCCKNDAFYQCTLILPPSAVFQKIVGPRNKNSHAAKKLVCLEACKKLHCMGALNDFLLPHNEEACGNSHSEKNNKNSSGPGTTKRKELHGTETVHALSGTWALPPVDIKLHAYHLKFSCDVETYNDFVLLLEPRLDDEIAVAKMDLFLFPNKLVRVSVTPCGQVYLKSEKVRKAMLFHEFFFNGIFGKLLVGGSKTKREFMFKVKNLSLWSTLNMYLLLPIELSLSIFPSIDWKCVDACASAIDFVNSIYSSKVKYFDENCSFCNTHSPDKEIEKQNSAVHLANKCILIHNLKHTVVLAIHTGKIYTVLDVELDRSANDPFDSVDDRNSSDYTTYTDFFLKKHKIVLQHPEQPLLLLKQSHNPHNLLIPRYKYEDTLMEKVLMHAHMPPETLVYVDVFNHSNDVIKAFYLLPSVMHRLESLMLACQLKQKIACCPNDHKISSALILEAITTSRCNESFSLERLELMGDSVLKYFISGHLFCKHPKKHEGQLTSLRTLEICNSKLHKVGTDKNLQIYIRDCPFDARRWAAPGQICLFPSPCKCDLDTSKVPLDIKYMTEKAVKIGKPCDRNHRWMCSKTIADCVESLIGAYYIGGGLNSAFSLMRWLGIDCEFDLIAIKEAKKNASFLCHRLKIGDIEALESKIDYEFHVKGLLVEAITHPSKLESYCYQRLEFLGDSVLDLLITSHLFQTYTDIDQGELTDLRSAVVSNGNFSKVAVRNNFHKYLQHGSTALSQKITEYYNCVEWGDNCTLDFSFGTSEGPKVLGDIVESIAGSIIIDTEFCIDVVWRIFEQLLSPIVSPDKLELQPIRELIELCSHLGYFINTNITNRGQEAIVELSVQLKDVCLVRYGCDKKRKHAKAQAALLLLKDLKEREISHTHHLSKVKSQEGKAVEEACKKSYTDLNINNFTVTPTASQISDSSATVSKTQKSMVCFSKNDDANDKDKPVIVSLKMEKGAPRICLFHICKQFQWPLPKFEAMEQKSRVPILFEGPYSETRTGYNSFVSTITLCIPGSTVITLVGEPCADKKISQDSACLNVLFELQKQGKCLLNIV